MRRKGQTERERESHKELKRRETEEGKNGMEGKKTGGKQTDAILPVDADNHRVCLAIAERASVTLHDFHPASSSAPFAKLCLYNA